jgi:dTDP-4-dehydrorhamnose 3,5-epimerase
MGCSVQVEQTELAGVLILTPRVFGDARGSFSESWNRRVLAEAGVDLDFVQDNQSISGPVGTVRGLHYQSPPHAQDKLVRWATARSWMWRWMCASARPPMGAGSAWS